MKNPRTNLNQIIVLILTLINKKIKILLQLTIILIQAKV